MFKVIKIDHSSLNNNLTRKEVNELSKLHLVHAVGVEALKYVVGVHEESLPDVHKPSKMKMSTLDVSFSRCGQHMDKCFSLEPRKRITNK